MKKSYFFIAVLTLIFLTNTGISQESVGGIPPSFHTSGLTENIEIITLSSPDISQFQLEDEEDDNNNFPQRIATNVPVFIDIHNSGTWEKIGPGGKIWRVKLVCNGALAINVQFDKFHLPKGGKLFLYNSDNTQILGAYTNSNNHETGLFSTELLEGDEVTIEYYEPKGSTEYTEISISEIAYAYRNVSSVFQNTKNFGDSEWCEVNVNCSPEGDNWQDEKRGVARILYKDGSYWYWCTGSLVNNTLDNGIPYFLTADHCGGTASASDRNQWIFYFNYESSGCSNPGSSPTYNSKTGASLKARGNISGGSDFQLVQLNSAPASYYNVYYNGWDRSGSSSSSGVAIHHPAGDIKKISTYNSTLTSATWNGSGYIGATNAHWRAYWIATSNGHGVNEGGSSGSPVFNSSGRVLGTLTGGSSSCNNPYWSDLYGKFSYHWQSNGGSSAYQLKPWLDPNNSGVTYLDGYDPNANNPPVADFEANITDPETGQTVNFSDLSSDNPTSWSWSFSPATVTYVGGTNSTTQNPQVQFNAEGSYTVSLTASNAFGSDNETKTNYINVSYYCGASGAGNYLHISRVQLETIDNSSGQDFYFDYTNLSTDITLNQSYNITITNGDLYDQSDLGIWIDYNQDGDFYDSGENIVCDIDNFGEGTFNFTVPGTALTGTTRMRIRTKYVDSNCGDPCGTTTYGEVEDYSVNIVLGVDPPVADFEADNLTPGIGETVYFTDLSSNSPALWSWTFTPSTVSYLGGTSSESQNPEVQFNVAGNYTVELTAINTGGSDSEIKTDYITVVFVPVADFSADNLTPEIGETVNFTDLSTNVPTSWAWTYSPSTVTYIGGTTASSQNPQVQFDASGNYIVELTATNISGSDTEIKTDYINVSIPYIDLEITVFLEGPFNTGNMNSDLITYLPLIQPYNADPWYYSGLESVTAFPGNIVDWVLIELRDASTASLAGGATSFDWQAAFIRNDGRIVDLNGNPVLHFESTVTDSLYVVIHQRNHLSIMTAFGLEEIGGIYSYNFTIAAEQAYGSGAQKLLETGIWGMYGGDGDHNGQVDASDKSTIWENQVGSNDYLDSDYNLDGESDNKDKNNIWLPNDGESKQVPE